MRCAPCHETEGARRIGRVHLRTLLTMDLGIRELRGRLTSLVRRAGDGERIIVTIGGRPVAQLGPIEPREGDVTLADLVARGLVEPAHRGDRPADPGVVVDTWTGGRLDRALREVRGA